MNFSGVVLEVLERVNISLGDARGGVAGHSELVGFSGMEGRSMTSGDVGLRVGSGVGASSESDSTLRMVARCGRLAK